MANIALGAHDYRRGPKTPAGPWHSSSSSTTSISRDLQDWHQVELSIPFSVPFVSEGLLVRMRFALCIRFYTSVIFGIDMSHATNAKLVHGMFGVLQGCIPFRPAILS